MSNLQKKTTALYSGGTVQAIYFELYILEAYMEGNSTPSLSRLLFYIL